MSTETLFKKKGSWIGVTSEVKDDVTIPMGYSWSYERTIRDYGNAPNTVLEKYIRPFRKVFGKSVAIPENVRITLRKELMERCANGRYIFSGMVERARMRRLATTIVR